MEMFKEVRAHCGTCKQPIQGWGTWVSPGRVTSLNGVCAEGHLTALADVIWAGHRSRRKQPLAPKLRVGDLFQIQVDPGLPDGMIGLGGPGKVNRVALGSFLAGNPVIAT